MTPPTRLQATPLEAGLVLLQLQSEDGMNRLDLPLLRALAAAPREHPRASGFILNGGAKYFSVGADLNGIHALAPPEAFALSLDGQACFQAMADSPAPFAAVIAGFCLGGGFDLALACRWRVCAPGAYLGHHGARLGLLTGWGGTQRLPRLIGPGRSLLHLLTARGWTGRQALDDGVADALCETPDLLPRAVDLLRGDCQA